MNWHNSKLKQIKPSVIVHLNVHYPSIPFILHSMWTYPYLKHLLHLNDIALPNSASLSIQTSGSWVVNLNHWTACIKIGLPNGIIFQNSLALCPHNPQVFQVLSNYGNEGNYSEEKCIYEPVVFRIWFRNSGVGSVPAVLLNKQLSVIYTQCWFC